MGIACRRCGRNTTQFINTSKMENDIYGNPRFQIIFECQACDLEYVAFYRCEELRCGYKGEGGGEIPLDYLEGSKLFE